MAHHPSEYHHYQAYGKVIHSTYRFPELLPGGISRDVVIHPGPVERPEPSPDQPGACLKASTQEAILFWDKVGYFQVKTGNEVIVDPFPGVEERLLRLFILGPVMAVVLHQRGYLILHASAVSVGGRVAAFLGGSGWGKSTMAAALQARGHRLVADDIVAVDFDPEGQPLAYAGFPQLKLWPESAAALGESPENLFQLHPDFEKRALRSPEGFSHGSTPLGLIYELAARDEPEAVIEPLQPQAALMTLVRHTFVARLLQRTGTAAEHFQQCGRLVNAVPVRRLKRRRELADLAEVTRQVEADILSTGGDQLDNSQPE